MSFPPSRLTTGVSLQPPSPRTAQPEPLLHSRRRPLPADASRALLDGALIDGFPGESGPMALAGATIYVPTQRAARELGPALMEAAGGGLVLPRIAPLGAFEATQDGLLFEEPSALFPDAPDAARRSGAADDLGAADARLGPGAARRDNPHRSRRAAPFS